MVQYELHVKMIFDESRGRKYKYIHNHKAHFMWLLVCVVNVIYAVSYYTFIQNANICSLKLELNFTMEFVMSC